MNITKVFRNINTFINNWIMSPEPNAAGRIGLFRMIYSLFYLWHLSIQFSANLSGLPLVHRHHEVYLIRYFFHNLSEPLSPLFFYLLESALVASLIVLLFGYKTRLATIFVLVLGCIIESFYIAIDFEHATIILVFYIPFFMALDNYWGRTYSLDALLKERKMGDFVSPSNSHWRYSVPIRSMLVILSILFLSSAIFKVSFGGRWLDYPELMSHLVLQKNIRASVLGLPLNHLAPFIAQTPFLYGALRLFTLLFEGLFFLSLTGRNATALFVSTALIFHSVNALWLVVTFTPVMIGYGLFVDWQAIKTCFWSKKISLFRGVPSSLLIFSTLFSAVLIGSLWNSNLGVRDFFNMGGLVDVRTIWYPVLPLSLIWFLTALARSVGLKFRLSEANGAKIPNDVR